MALVVAFAAFDVGFALFGVTFVEPGAIPNNTNVIANNKSVPANDTNVTSIHAASAAYNAANFSCDAPFIPRATDLAACKPGTSADITNATAHGMSEAFTVPCVPMTNKAATPVSRPR